MSVISKDKEKKVGDRRIDKDCTKLSDGCKICYGLFLAPWQLADNVITSCSNTDPMYTKEAILCCACLSVPLRQIKNFTFKVRKDMFKTEVK